MKQNTKLCAICLGLILSISCVKNAPIEGAWEGKILEKQSRQTATWVITFTKAGNDYSGQLIGRSEDGVKESTLREVKTEGQKVSFILGNYGETKCEGAISGNNLKGKCRYNLESTPNGLQKGEEMIAFELTKK